MRSFLAKLILAVLVEALEDERVRAFVADQVARLADHLLDRLVPDVLERMLPDIVSTFPTFGASVVKSALEKLPNLSIELPAVGELAKETAEKIVNDDPDIPFISNVFDLTETLKKFLGFGR